MRSVLKSIQPQKQPDLAKPLLSSIQRKQPILSPAPLGNAQPSTSKGAVNALNAKPSTLKSASYAETAPACRKPSLDRKRDAEGRLRKENNYQAGLSPANAWLLMQPCVGHCASTYPLLPEHVHKSQATKSRCVCVLAGTAYSNTSGPAARCRVEAESAGADDDDAVEEDDVQQVKQAPVHCCCMYCAVVSYQPNTICSCCLVCVQGLCTCVSSVTAACGKSENLHDFMPLLHDA